MALAAIGAKTAAVQHVKKKVEHVKEVEAEEEEELETEAEVEGEEEEEEEGENGDTSDSTSSTGKTLAQTLRQNDKVVEQTLALETSKRNTKDLEAKLAARGNINQQRMQDLPKFYGRSAIAILKTMR